ncbi:iron ABC transporter ATP-binding protein [Pseudogemmobacter sonorensis]|uniref:iron ABC transporter ATP-binding protein n=1 Tax=Pseudogemmobacter sonorensis TaxID=2989681 RepID=UPI0036D1E558
MIATKGVRKSYGPSVVLDDVTVDLPKNALTAIIGPNGAGKSTLLAVVSRLLGMEAGSASVDGLDVTRTPSDVLARKLSILRQDNHMTARLTVRDLVSFGRYPYSRGRLTAQDHAQVDRALDWLDLRPLAGRFLDELSGGQRQRAFAAMVVCQDTDYILLDEPLNNLDMKHAQAVMTLLRRMCSELGKTVVVVLHDINFASWYSDHIVALKDGRLCRHGSTAEIMTAEALREIYDMEIDIIDCGGRRLAIYYGAQALSA